MTPVQIAEARRLARAWKPKCGQFDIAKNCEMGDKSYAEMRLVAA